MIRLKCPSCGFGVTFEESRGEFCPRCLACEDRTVALVAVSDGPPAVDEPGASRLSLHSSGPGDRHTVVLEGELDLATAPALEAMVAELCAAGAREIVLDMAAVEFVDSSGLNAILRSRMLCEESSCVFWLTPGQRPVRNVFKITGVARRFPWSLATRRG